MKLTNLTNKQLRFKDVERGLDNGIYKHRIKQAHLLGDSSILYLIDTSNALLSASKGDIARLETDSQLTNVPGLLSSNTETFNLTTGDFKVVIDGGAIQTFTLSTGAAITALSIASTINGSATGFAAEDVNGKVGLYATGGSLEIKVGAGGENTVLGFYVNQTTKS